MLPSSIQSSLPPAPEPPRRTGWRRVLAVPTPVIFVLSLAIALGLLWRQGTLGDLGHTVRNADPGVLVAAGLLYLVSVTLLCLRWQALVQMAGGRYDPGRAAEALLTSVVVNYAAPKGLAVPTRALLSARDLNLSATASGAISLWDLALDLVALALMSLVWILGSERAILARLPVPDRGIVGAVAVASGLLIGGALVAGRLRPDWTAKAQAAVREMVTYPGRRPGAATMAVVLTAAYWIAQTVVFRLMLTAVGLAVDQGWQVVLGLLALPTLIGMFAPTPGGAGVREALMVLIAQADGLPGAPVLLAAVAYRVALLIAVPVLYVAVRAWRQYRERGWLHGRAPEHE